MKFNIILQMLLQFIYFFIHHNMVAHKKKRETENSENVTNGTIQANQHKL